MSTTVTKPIMIDDQVHLPLLQVREQQHGPSGPSWPLGDPQLPTKQGPWLEMQSPVLCFKNLVFILASYDKMSKEWSWATKVLSCYCLPCRIYIQLINREATFTECFIDSKVGCLKIGSAAKTIRPSGSSAVDALFVLDIRIGGESTGEDGKVDDDSVDGSHIRMDIRLVEEIQFWATSCIRRVFHFFLLFHALFDMLLSCQKKFFFQFVESDLTENLDLQAILRAPVNGWVVMLFLKTVLINLINWCHRGYFFYRIYRFYWINRSIRFECFVWSR